MPEQVRGERCAQLSPGVHRLLRTLLAVHPWEVAELREDEEGGPPSAGVLGEGKLLLGKLNGILKNNGRYDSL